MALVITKRMRRHAVRQWGAKDDATTAELNKLFAKKLFAGSIGTDDIDRINQGTWEAPDKPKKSAGGGAGTKTAKPKVKPKKAAPKGDDTDDDDADDDDPDPKPKKKSATADDIQKAVNKALRKAGVVGAPGDVDLDPEMAFNRSTRIRVKEAADGYSTTKSAAVYPQFVANSNGQQVHPLAGRPAKCGDTLLDNPSDRDKAVALAYVRWMANKNNMTGQPLPRWLRMTDHDRELVLYAVHNEKWVGKLTDGGDGEQYVKRAKLKEFQIKTMLDDSVSGGIEITPTVFDDALVLTPVLYGELFPFVKVETVTKGRRVKGGSMINPEFTSGTAEGTAITPFNTSAFVTAFDTPIYPAVSAIELGQDFEDDSQIDIGGQIVEQFGLKALEWLDRVIAVGNGFSEPQGFFNATAATLVNSTFGAGGPMTVSDYEGLEFGVGKEYRGEPGAFMAYVSNDYTYRKARAIKVGEGDQRRVFGLDQQSYTLLGYPYKVQNSIADGYAAFINLRRYRMYRRLGMQVRVEMGGRQLALNNTRLIVVRMRYGGQLEKGGAAALMKDAGVM